MSLAISAARFPIDRCSNALQEVSDLESMNTVCELFASIPCDLCYRFVDEFFQLARTYYPAKEERKKELAQVITQLHREIPPKKFEEIAILTAQIVKFKKLTHLISETQIITLNDLLTRMTQIVKKELPLRVATLANRASQITNISELPFLVSLHTRYHELFLRYQVFPEDQLGGFSFQMNEAKRLCEKYLTEHVGELTEEESQIEKRTGKFKPLELEIPRRFFETCERAGKLWTLKDTFQQQREAIERICLHIEEYVTGYISSRDRDFDNLTTNDLPKFPNFIEQLSKLTVAAESFLNEESLKTLFDLFKAMQSWTEDQWGTSPYKTTWQFLMEALEKCVGELKVYCVKMSEESGYIVVDWENDTINVDDNEIPHVLRIYQVCVNWLNDLKEKTGDHKKNVGEARAADGRAEDRPE